MTTRTEYHVDPHLDVVGEGLEARSFQVAGQADDFQCALLGLHFGENSCFVQACTPGGVLFRLFQFRFQLREIRREEDGAPRGRIGCREWQVGQVVQHQLRFEIKVGSAIFFGQFLGVQCCRSHGT